MLALHPGTLKWALLTTQVSRCPDVGADAAPTLYITHARARPARGGASMIECNDRLG